MSGKPHETAGGEPGAADPSLTPAPAARGARVDPLIGKVIDNRYRLVSLIARGGMGKVYRAEQAQLNRVVALKLLEIGKNGDQDEEFRRRFMLEAATYARLTHPHTVRIFDYGNTWDDILFIAMEFLDGRTLHHVIKTEAPLSAERTLRIARQICGSLREAHALGLVHRDLKPANVVLTRHGDDDEFVKVLDFGLVKELTGDSELTSGDAVVGSPSYMAPEQIRADGLDQRTDIYALGVILYACVCGRTPFAGDNSVNVLLAHLNQPPPPLSPNEPALRDSPTLAWLIETCLAKDRASRFADVDELVRALRLCDAEVRGERGSQPSLVGGRVLLDGRAPPPSTSQVLPAHGEAPAVAETSISSFVTAISRTKGPILAVGSLLLAAVAVVVIVGGGAFYLRHERLLGTPAPNEGSGGRAAADVLAGPTSVRLTTVPATAHVFHDEVDLGESPVVLPLAAGESWNVRIVADGFQPAVAHVNAGDDPVRIELQRDAGGPELEGSENAAPSQANASQPSAGSDVGGPNQAGRALPTSTGTTSAKGRPQSVPSPTAGPAASPPSTPAATLTPSPPAPPESVPSPSKSSDLRDPWAH